MRDFALDASSTCGLIIDVQERFVPAIPSLAADQPVGQALRILAAGLALFEIPCLVTEQVPDKLGPTLDYITAEIPNARIQAKSAFSCMDDPAISDALVTTHAETLIVAGIEAHICVLSTVDDLITHGYRVVVVDDAVASRRPSHHASAMTAMRDLGALVVPVESVLFRLQGSADGDRFRTLSKLVK